MLMFMGRQAKKVLLISKTFQIHTIVNWFHWEDSTERISVTTKQKIRLPFLIITCISEMYQNPIIYCTSSFLRCWKFQKLARYLRKWNTDSHGPETVMIIIRIQTERSRYFSIFSQKLFFYNFFFFDCLYFLPSPSVTVPWN